MFTSHRFSLFLVTTASLLLHQYLSPSWSWCENYLITLAMVSALSIIYCTYLSRPLSLTHSVWCTRLPIYTQTIALTSCNWLYNCIATHLHILHKLIHTFRLQKGILNWINLAIKTDILYWMEIESDRCESCTVKHFINSVTLQNCHFSTELTSLYNFWNISQRLRRDHKLWELKLKATFKKIR